MPRIYNERQLNPYTVMLSHKLVEEIDKIAESFADTRGHIMRLMIIHGVKTLSKYPIKDELLKRLKNIQKYS